MNRLNLAAIIISALMLSSGFAQAHGPQNNDALNQNFISKRPYNEPVTISPNSSGNEFEGATLEKEQLDENERAGIKNLKTLRINQFSKRPYHE